MMRLDGIIWYQWLNTKNNIIDSAVGIGAIGAFIVFTLELFFCTGAAILALKDYQK